MSMFNALRGQTAVVVGAGVGIGRAAAVLLGRCGVAVVCADRDLDGAQDTATAIEGDDGQASAVWTDVTDEESVEAVFKSAVARFGQVHIAVGCAGITGPTNVPVHEFDMDVFDAVYRVNLRGALAVSRAAASRMVRHGYGRIVHVASIAGKEGNPYMVAYSASKAGLIGLVKAQGKELAQSGVTVNALAPAVIHTDLVAALPQETVDYMTEKIPMRRTGTLDEAASMIAFMVSPECSFTTGFTFDLSGGRATY